MEPWHTNPIHMVDGDYDKFKLADGTQDKMVALRDTYAV
jgi:hypothetical protein